MRPSLLVAPALAFCAGCATPPPSDPEFANTAHVVQTVALGQEFDEPAALPRDDVLDHPHHVDYYVQLALDQNPTIRAAQRRVSAQAEVIPQVTALNDPVLSDTFFPIDGNSPQTAAGRAPNMLTLSQKFPWLDKLRVRGEVAEQDAQIALSELAAAQLKVIEDVKLAYHEVAYTQRAVEITTSSKHLLSDLLKFAEARYRTGGSQQDVLRAMLELDTLQNRLIILNKSLQMAQADLASALHTSPEARPKAATDALDPSVPQQIDELYEAAVRCRPELQQRLHAIIKAERGEQLARLDYLPDMAMGIGWQAVTQNNALSPVSNGRDNVALTMGVTLPIWRDKLRAGVREAEHRAVEAARRYDATRDDTFRAIRRLVVQARALEEQIQLFRRPSTGIIARAQQTLRISAADYQVNKVDFEQINANWNNLLMFEIQVIRLEASLAQTLASLERVVGCELVSADTGNAIIFPVPEPSTAPESK